VHISRESTQPTERHYAPSQMSKYSENKLRLSPIIGLMRWSGHTLTRWHGVIVAFGSTDAGVDAANRLRVFVITGNCVLQCINWNTNARPSCGTFSLLLYPVYTIKLARRAGYMLAGRTSSTFARCLLDRVNGVLVWALFSS